MPPFFRMIIPLAVLSASTAQAQAPSAPQASKRENVTYHMIEFLKFKPGQRGRANALIRDYFSPSEIDVGVNVADYRMLTGEWDAIEAHPLPGGPGDLEWTMSPKDVRLTGALIKRAGGVEAANKILDEWEALIERREYQVAFSRLHPAPAK